MQKSLAEFIGTFTLVFLGCGSALLAGFDVIGQTGISFAFGLGLISMAYGIGAISGCHINPAVSLGAFVAGRMSFGDLIQYVIAQCAGAIAGAFVLLVIVKGRATGFDMAGGFATNGWDAVKGYSMVSAFVFETVATFLFVVTILGSTHKASAGVVAGLAIGLALVAIHLVGIQVTGVSVNPARSLGPALVAFVGGNMTPMAQLWLFIAAPCLGAFVAGLLFRNEMLYHRDIPR